MLPAFNLYLVLDEFAVKCLTFDHRLWFLGKPECSLRHCLHLNLQELFLSMKHLNGRRLQQKSIHLSVRNYKRSYFSSLLRFFLKNLVYFISVILLYFYLERRKNISLQVCDKFNLNLTTLGVG